MNKEIERREEAYRKEIEKQAGHHEYHQRNHYPPTVRPPPPVFNGQSAVPRAPVDHTQIEDQEISPARRKAIKAIIP